MTSLLDKGDCLAFLLLTLLIGELAACGPAIGPHDPSMTGSGGRWRLLSQNPRSTFANASLYGRVDKSRPQVSGGLWDLIRADFQLPSFEEKASVQAQIRWFVNRPSYLNKIISQAAPYIYYIYEQVKRHNLPAELVLLPIIESAYSPLATNHKAEAVGLWQLTPGTARGFGVHRDWLFDGRRDIDASTKAALNYLIYLHTYFSGDWLLAIAAYNTGEGNLQRAIRHNLRQNRTTHFWGLPLAIETRSYIPRLLAVVNIIRNPSKYGLTLPTISVKPYLARVYVGPGISLSQAAHLAGVRLAKLKQLNPGFKSSFRPLNRPCGLMLPIDRVSLFKQRIKRFVSTPNVYHNRANEKQLSNRFLSTVSERSANRATGQHHPVKPGETLISIARHYQVSVENLGRWNHLKATDVLRVGKNLIILADKGHFQAHKPVNRPTQKEGYYVVRPNDNLSSIAKRLKVKVTELKVWNHLKHNVLQPGQRLRINRPPV